VICFGFDFNVSTDLAITNVRKVQKNVIAKVRKLTKMICGCRLALAVQLSPHNNKSYRRFLKKISVLMDRNLSERGEKKSYQNNFNSIRLFFFHYYISE
jgi:hypothetical protein